MENKGNTLDEGRNDQLPSEKAVPGYDAEKEAVEGTNDPESDKPDTGERTAEDEIADKGEPRPFEEGWKEQEKFRAD